MRKKTLYTILILSAIILAACGGGAVSEEPEVPSATEAAIATESAPENSVKPPLPTHEIGPQLPEVPDDLTCNIDGYEEMVEGEIVGMAMENGQDVAEVEIVGEDLVFTSLANGKTQKVPIEYGDQSHVNFAYLTIPIDLGNNQTRYAEFLLVTCGDHVYIPVK